MAFAHADEKPNQWSVYGNDNYQLLYQPEHEKDSKKVPAAFGENGDHVSPYSRRWQSWQPNVFAAGVGRNSAVNVASMSTLPSMAGLHHGALRHASDAFGTDLEPPPPILVLIESDTRSRSNLNALVEDRPADLGPATHGRIVE